MVTQMNFENATKEQLLQIALHEPCELEYKYEAIKQLHYRQIPEDVQADILYRFGIGIEIEDIASENGLSVMEVKNFIRNRHKRNKSEENWKIGYKHTLRAVGCLVN